VAVSLPAEVTAITRRFLELIDASAPGLVTGLYLRGSLAFGEYFPGQSDVDFTAVLAKRPSADQLGALASAHAAVYDAHPAPHFDGFHLLRSDLASPPVNCPDLPCMFAGRLRPAGRFDVNPVSWHELAERAVVIRGPAVTEADVWTDDDALLDYTHANLTSYWAGVGEELRAQADAAVTPRAVAWCVLGVSRLHHLLATGALTSKSGAGRYALTAFGPRWQPIVREALRARERPAATSEYEHDPDARGRDAKKFTGMAIESGLALRT
jgi:hypothetical protein